MWVCKKSISTYLIGVGFSESRSSFRLAGMIGKFRRSVVVSSHELVGLVCLSILKPYCPFPVIVVRPSRARPEKSRVLWIGVSTFVIVPLHAMAYAVIECRRGAAADTGREIS
jgi:hypothetical protein